MSAYDTKIEVENIECLETKRDLHKADWLSLEDNAEEDAMCEQHGVQNCLAFLTQEMKHLGIIPYSGDNLVESDLQTLINRTLKLVALHHKTTREYNELHKRHLRTTNDLHSSQTCVVRLKETIEERQRFIKTVEEHGRRLSLENTKLANKLKSSENEIKRLNSVMQARDAQLRNEIRKKEGEVSRLHDRIHALLGDRNKDKRFGVMELSNTLSRRDSSRAKWKTSENEKIQEREMHERVIQTLEDRHLCLVTENNHLRSFICNRHRQLTSLVQESEKSHERSVVGDNVSVRLKECHFNLPWDIVSPLLEEDFQLQMQSLEKELAMTRANENQEEVVT